jgi:O-antigen ligase
MTSLKTSRLAAIGIGSCLALYLIYTHLGYFGDITFLGGILMLEIIVASIWNFEQRFFALILIIFLWAGMHVPLESAGTLGRWVVLAAGAAVGFVIWIQVPRKPFRTIHLIALFCICMALISATVSSFIQAASLKAVSLGLLFLYCASGARLALLGREERFFRELLLGCEISVYVTAFCYFIMHASIWGNPNSLGAAMSIGVFPILLWGWFISDQPVLRNRRLIALLLCAYLVRFSLSRAALVTVVGVAFVFCVCLRRYRLLMKMTALVLLVASVGALLAPTPVMQQITNFKDDFLYKGHKEEGVMGSRRGPWDESVTSIKVHPWFGTGYGTSPTVEDAGLRGGNVSTSAEMEREHGSSYIMIAEWVGLVGVLPFIALLALTVRNVWKVCVLMYRTANVRYYSIPLAMVVVGGLIHATFEDWIFAAGSYLALYFWVCAFLLSDLVPEVDMVPRPAAASRSPHPLATDYGTAVSNS